MAGLADYVSVRPRFARSANLERDSGRPEPFDGYIVTARALDVIERMTGAALSGRSGGAWSLTGPYGSGKSSLALLLDAAFGPNKRVRNVVLSLIAEASPEAAETVRKAHERHGTRRTGFHRGLVTANREPITHTLLRALHAAVLGAYGRIPSGARLCGGPEAPERGASGSWKRRICPARRACRFRHCRRSPAVWPNEAPLLLVLDEFGKSLEAIRDGGDADPYVLQQLAEAGTGRGTSHFHRHPPASVVSTTTWSARRSSKRREWAKVQGRFEDVAYVESARQTRALIGSVFEVRDDAAAGTHPAPGEDSYTGNLRDLGSCRRDGRRSPGVLLSPASPWLRWCLPELVQPLRAARTHPVLVSGGSGPGKRSFLPRRQELCQLAVRCRQSASIVVYDYFVAERRDIEPRSRAVEPLDRDRHAAARHPRALAAADPPGQVHSAC